VSSAIAVIGLSRSAPFEPLLPIAEEVVLVREVEGNAEDEEEQDHDDAHRPNDDVKPVEHYSDR
jgi:hypothetical protein